MINILFLSPISSVRMAGVARGNWCIGYSLLNPRRSMCHGNVYILTPHYVLRKLISTLRTPTQISPYMRPIHSKTFLNSGLFLNSRSVRHSTLLDAKRTVPTFTQVTQAAHISRTQAHSHPTVVESLKNSVIGTFDELLKICSFEHN